MRILTIVTLLLLHLGSTETRAQTSWRKIKEELVFNQPPFAQCHASTVAESASGEIMMACFGGTREGNKDVGIWMSKLKGDKWEKPEIMAEGIINDTLRYPCWNPVLFKENSGKLFLFYKVGPTTRKWWGEYRTSTDNGQSWSKSIKLPDGILGPIKNKPVQLKDGTILSPVSTQYNDVWKVHLEKSVDKGKSWEIIPIDPKTSYEVIQPSVLIYPKNKLQVLCRSKQDSIIRAWSYDNGKTWGRFQATNLPNPNSGTDAVTLKDGTQLLVYNPTKHGKKWYNGREKLNVAISKDGENWTDVMVLENGKEKEDYSYPAVIQTKDGKVHITYTYNRKNIKYVVLETK